MDLIFLKEFKAMFVYKVEPNIIYLKFKEAVDLEEEEMKSIIEFTLQFSEIGYIYYITDVRVQLHTMSQEARSFLANHTKAKELGIKSAILAENIGVRLVANFYISVMKPNIPTKLFKDEDTALKWLQSFNS